MCAKLLGMLYAASPIAIFCATVIPSIRTSPSLTAIVVLPPANPKMTSTRGEDQGRERE
jgi:hypothetical protein